MTKKKIALLGATGSIGTSTLAILEAYPEKFELESCAAGTRVNELVAIAKKFNPKRVAIASLALLETLKAALKHEGLVHIEALAGEAAMIELAQSEANDTVVQAIVGAAGVAPTFAAAKAGKRLLLANKESVVCGGALLMETIERHRATLLPIDSEHHAIFECLEGISEQTKSKSRLILTASGGPFRGRTDLSGITPEMAVAHPKWSMGQKISVDSATLMNKGLEVIEARWLFDVPADRIDVVVHPESIIHSMVEFEDRAILAQLGSADMKTPIAYALNYPHRLNGMAKKLDFATLNTLHFEAPDRKTFKLLDVAYQTLEEKASASIVMNAANEIAVEYFLKREIAFKSIPEVIMEMLSRESFVKVGSVEEILAIDQRTREQTRHYLQGLI